LSELAQNGFGLFPQSTGGGLLNENWFNLVILILLTSCGVLALPQVIHKFYAVKNKAAINRALIVSTIFAFLIGGGAYFAGSLSRLFTLPEGTTGDMIMPIILEQVIPPGLLGLIVVLLLSASMSTLSSLSITGASSVVVDIYKGYIRKDAEDKNINLFLRVVSLIFIAMSALLAILEIDAIVTMMSLSWGTLAGCFIGPYIYGIYSKKITKAAAYTSIIGGVAITIAFVLLFGFMFPDPRFSGFVAVLKGGIGKSPLIGVIAMAFSMIATPLVSIFTKKPDYEKTADMFRGITD
jgi:Na+/proline symporter